MFIPIVATQDYGGWGRDCSKYRMKLSKEGMKLCMYRMKLLDRGHETLHVQNETRHR